MWVASAQRAVLINLDQVADLQLEIMQIHFQYGQETHKRSIKFGSEAEAARAWKQIIDAVHPAFSL